MDRLLLTIILAAVVTNTASAASMLEAKLSAEVDKHGRVTASLVTNNDNSPICFLADETFVELQDSDGKAFGESGVFDFIRPESVDIIWGGGHSQIFHLPIGGSVLLNGDFVLAPKEARSLAKASARLFAYDCNEFLASKGYAGVLIERELDATPKFDR